MSSMPCKVSVTLDGKMHIEREAVLGKTLCGQTWYYYNNHGEGYCKHCQRIYAGMVRRKGDRNGNG